MPPFGLAHIEAWVCDAGAILSVRPACHWRGRFGEQIKKNLLDGIVKHHFLKKKSHLPRPRLDFLFYERYCADDFPAGSLTQGATLLALGW